MILIIDNDCDTQDGLEGEGLCSRLHFHTGNEDVNLGKNFYAVHHPGLYLVFLLVPV